MTNSSKEKITAILAQLEQRAKENGDVLGQEEVSAAFSEIDMSSEQQAAVLQYFSAKNIEVIQEEKTVRELSDIPQGSGFSFNEEDVLVIADDEYDDEVSSSELDMIESEEMGDEDLYEISMSVSIEDPVRMYLKEIGQYPLLTPVQEVGIAVRIDNGSGADILLKDIFGVESEEADRKVSSEDLERYEFYDDTKAVLHGKNRKDLERISRDGTVAKDKLIESNLRLVVSIAKKYTGRGMQMLDLIQEGNLGLMKAVDKFDYRKGYKFSTYATWWIRQAITRAIADQARTIRVPVHMVETVNKFIRISRKLVQELGREPLPQEVAAAMDVTEDKVMEIIKLTQEPMSLDTPVGEEEDTSLGDFISDDKIEDPVDAASFMMLKEMLNEVLKTLTEREQKVLRLRFGLDTGVPMTLEEVGQEFKVTRERIRQIEAKSLRKLRAKSRATKLVDWVK